MITLTNSSIRRATNFGLAVMAFGATAGLAVLALGDSSAKAATCTIDWTGPHTTGRHDRHTT